MQRALEGLQLLIDPEIIVLGGFIPAPILVRIAEQLPGALAEGARIGAAPSVVIGAAGQDTSVLGAAALPVFGEFTPTFNALLKR